LFNRIHYAGTAGINIYKNTQNALAYGNTLFKNRYEISDGSGGGQLYLEGEKCPLGVECGSRAAIVAGNVIWGGQWPPPPTLTPLPTGCLLPTERQFNAGVEGYGFGHFFYNNEVSDHTGSGMQFAASNSTGRITISSAPYFPEDTVQRFIEGNSAGGIVFIGWGWCNVETPGTCYPAIGVTFDAVFVAKNSLGSISLEDVSNALDESGMPIINPRVMNKESTPQVSATYTGFFNGACLIGNKNRAGELDDTPEFGQLLMRPLPSSITTYVATTTPLSCPSPWWEGDPPPAAPYRPGWPW
jgi:hypothetical protein